MDALIGGLVGAVLTFIGQWYLAPRIERRVRAQERWEQFVIDFAHHVDGPLERSQLAARLAWSRWDGLRHLVQERDDLDMARVATLNDKNRLEFRDRLDEWQEAMRRGRWLVDRITGDYRIASADQRTLASRWLFYGHHVYAFHAFDDGPGGTQEDWNGLAEDRKLLLGSIEKLSHSIGPPVSRVQRLRAWRRRRREAAKQRERDELKRGSGNAETVLAQTTDESGDQERASGD